MFLPARRLAIAIATGVFPVPPAVRLPMQITFGLARYGCAWAALQATVAPYTQPAGARAAASIRSSDPFLVQNSGARIGQQRFYHLSRYLRGAGERCRRDRRRVAHSFSRFGLRY